MISGLFPLIHLLEACSYGYFKTLMHEGLDKFQKMNEEQQKNVQEQSNNKKQANNEKQSNNEQQPNKVQDPPNNEEQLNNPKNLIEQIGIERELKDEMCNRGDCCIFSIKVDFIKGFCDTTGQICPPERKLQPSDYQRRNFTYWDGISQSSCFLEGQYQKNSIVNPVFRGCADLIEKTPPTETKIKQKCCFNFLTHKISIIRTEQKEKIYLAFAVCKKICESKDIELHQSTNLKKLLKKNNFLNKLHILLLSKRNKEI